jgi:regulator of sirC expression with transglutaminase-like and TPR domain
MEQPDVFEGALRIARLEYPDLDPELYRARVAAFADAARARVSAQGRRGVGQLNEVFFGDLGFRGNREDYYDPRNSYLNEVIDRRTGIPITLSTVYCEVARRIGLSAHGVGFPGHFLVKCFVPGSEVIVDCFGGRVLTRDDCQALLNSLQPEPVALSDEMLAVASPRDILSRMLHNLRRIHASRKDYARALRWVELDMEFNPGSPLQFRERGMLHLQMEQFGKALVDLERYLSLAPTAPDLPQLREQIQLIRKLLSRLN